MLQIAKILKSNGTDGGILIGVRDIEPGQIELKEPVFIAFDGLPVPFFLASLTPHGTTKWLARRTDVSSLADAEELVGRYLLSESPGEEEEEYEDFTGWKVFDRGVPVGTVSSFEDIPGNPCICLDDNVLIPLHEDFISGMDEEKKELYLELPDGLLDLDSIAD
ncbi:MAG: hypothetical protein MJY57_04050 [Bacteroidales bacterium]|nr:hypothetical protein [Bacteroidales bacterium]